MPASAYSTSAWSFLVQSRIPTGGLSPSVIMFFFVPAYIGIELADVFVTELFQFQIHQNMTFEDAVVKHQVDEEMLITNQNAFLPGFETKSVAQFQQECFKFIDKLVFQMGFAHHFFGFETEKLENVRIADCQLRLFFLSALLCQFREFLFIA